MGSNGPWGRHPISPLSVAVRVSIMRWGDWIKRGSACLVAVIAITAMPSTAFAKLRMENEFTFTVDAEASRLIQEIDMHLVNTTPNKTSGNTITRFYFDRLELWVPEGAEDLEATSNGRALTVTIKEDPEEGYDIAEVRFGRRLFFRQSMDIKMKWLVEGDQPRSDSPFRVNPAYFSIPVLVFGEPGKVDVSVLVPISHQIDRLGDQLVNKGSEGSRQVFTASDIEEPETWFAWVTGTDDSKLVVTPIEVAGVELEVRAWPGDDEWAEDVLEATEVGFPILVELIGLEYQEETTLLVSESAHVNQAGYGGWYIESENHVEIGEFVDPDLVLHELAHIWFNDELFTSRWMSEGLAEIYAAEAAVRAGLAESLDVRELVLPGRRDDLQRLNQWRFVTATDFDDLDDWGHYEDVGYSFSEWFFQRVVDEVGFEALRDVISSMADHEIAYVGEPEPETEEWFGGWRGFLDMLEEQAGSEQATELFADYVTDQDLTERADAREEYQRIQDVADGWELPVFIREPMARWRFEEAVESMSAVGPLIDSRHEIEGKLTELDLEVDPTLEDLFELAEQDFADAESHAAELLDAVDDVLDLTEEHESDQGLIADVGLINVDVESEYRDAVDALDAEDFDAVVVESNELRAIYEDASRQGLIRIGLGLLALAIFVGIGWFVWRRVKASRIPKDRIVEAG